MDDRCKMQMFSFVATLLLAVLGAVRTEDGGYNYQQAQQAYLGPVPYPHQPHTSYGVPLYGPTPATPLYPVPLETPLPLTNTYPTQPTYLPPSPPTTEGWNKEFYSYEPPAEHFEDGQGLQQISSALQKNLRVIFIKTPENRGLQQAALALAKQTTEDRTAIYVLNKQNDLGELANRLNQFREHRTHKPEVHFVKYKTADEAAQAQQYIRAQYDQVQGVTTHNSNEGVAPVLNFASAFKAIASPSDQSGTPNYYGSVDGSPASGASAVSNAAPLNSQSGYPQTAGYSYNFNQDNGNSLAGGFNNGFADGYAKVARADEFAYHQPAFKANERHSQGSKFVFPSERRPGNEYLPPF